MKARSGPEPATEGVAPAGGPAGPPPQPPLPPPPRGARPPPPAARPPTATFQALLLAAAAALSGFTLLRGYGPHDEGLMLAWAERVADGQWPYRDFWSNYAPGQTVLLAALTKVLGPSLVTWRVLRVAVDALTALAAYRLV